jgi:hypothetical protein
MATAVTGTPDGAPQGRVTRAYLDDMEDQLSALRLVLNLTVLWNSVYLDRALDALRDQDYPAREQDAARLSAFMRKHMRLEGHYSSICPTSATGTGRCATPDTPDDDWP